jgi:uncharacterized protein YoxC
MGDKSDKIFKKYAMDERFVDADVVNPRNSLQYFHRSSEFVPQDMKTKLSSIEKLKEVCEDIKGKYGNSFEWFDSNTRVLLGKLTNTIQLFKKNGSAVGGQPSLQSLDYLQQMLSSRYRLNIYDLPKYSKAELEGIVLAHDKGMVEGNPERSESVNVGKVVDSLSSSSGSGSGPQKNVIINISNDNSKLDQLLKSIDKDFEGKSSDDLERLAERIQTHILSKYSDGIQEKIEKNLVKDVDVKKAELDAKIKKLEAIEKSIEDLAKKSNIEIVATPAVKSKVIDKDVAGSILDSQLNVLLAEYEILGRIK